MSAFRGNHPHPGWERWNIFCTKAIAIFDLRGKNKIHNPADVRFERLLTTGFGCLVASHDVLCIAKSLTCPVPNPPILPSVRVQTPACIFQLREGAHLRWVNPMTAEAVLPEKALNVCEDGAELRCHVDLKMGEHYLGRATLTVDNEDRGQNQV